MEESMCSVCFYCCKLTWFTQKLLARTTFLPILSLAMAPKAMLLICSVPLQLRAQVWNINVNFYFLEPKY